MSKSDTIEAIVNLNPTAKPDFLADFSNDDLHRYLHRLTLPAHALELHDSPSSAAGPRKHLPSETGPTNHTANVDPWTKFGIPNQA